MQALPPLFTIPGCSYCDMEKQAFLEATSQFGEWRGVSGTDFLHASFESEYLNAMVIEVDRAPYTYQPVFNENSPRSKVPLLVISGVYIRLGGPGSTAGIAEESARIRGAICTLLSATGEQPAACAG